MKLSFIKERESAWIAETILKNKDSLWASRDRMCHCTLHLQCRINIGILTGTVPRHVVNRTDITAARKDEILQNLVLFVGSVLRPKAASQTKSTMLNFKIKVDTQTSKVAPIELSNQRGEKVMKRYDELLNIIFETAEAKLHYEGQMQGMLRMVNLYNNIMSQLCQSGRKLSVQEIDELQDLMDEFVLAYTQEYKETEGNYVHSMGSGHCREDLLRFEGNIDIFNTTDIEALNGWLKKWYHYNTQHGGSSGKNTGAIESPPEASLRMMVRRWVEFCYPRAYEVMHYLKENDDMLKRKSNIITGDASLPGRQPGSGFDYNEKIMKEVFDRRQEVENILGLPQRCIDITRQKRSISDVFDDDDAAHDHDDDDNDDDDI